MKRLFIGSTIFTLSLVLIAQTVPPATPQPNHDSPVPLLDPFLNFKPKQQITDRTINDMMCIRVDDETGHGWLFIGPDDTLVFSTESCADAVEKDNRIHPRVVIPRYTL